MYAVYAANLLYKGHMSNDKLPKVCAFNVIRIVYETRVMSRVTYMI